LQVFHLWKALKGFNSGTYNADLRDHTGNIRNNQNWKDGWMDGFGAVLLWNIAMAAMECTVVR